MALTPGALSKVSATDTVVKLSSTAPTGGTTPYLYQWYRSVIAGFTPAVGNAISGATALTLTDSALVPGTTYYYKQVQTDSNATPLTATPVGLTVATLVPALSQNVVAMSPILGQIDQKIDYDTIPVQIDISQATPLRAGQAVKIVDSAGGVPKVIACAANSDEVYGFINFDVKSPQFAAGDLAEISQAGNVIYLYATTAIARGAQVTLDFAYLGGVASKNTGDKIVGWAFDKAAGLGSLIRVRLTCPSYTVA